jgi:hypothetical protein
LHSRSTCWRMVRRGRSLVPPPTSNSKR